MEALKISVASIIGSDRLARKRRGQSALGDGAGGLTRVAGDSERGIVVVAWRHVFILAA